MKVKINNVASRSFKILLCLVMLFVFAFVQPLEKVKATTLPLPAEMAKDGFLGVVGALMTLGAHGATQMDYLTEKTGEILNTASNTWDLMSQDLKDNFSQSMTQLGDGIILTGDLITSVLDALKPSYNGTISTSAYTLTYPYNSQMLIVAKDGYVFKESRGGKTSTKLEFYINLAVNEILITDDKGNYWAIGKYLTDTRIEEFYDLLRTNSADLGHMLEFATIVQNTSIVLEKGGASLGQTDEIYNQIDNWLRDNYLPRVDAGEVIFPNTQAWTPEGDRVYVNTDGSTLVLEDGTPYSGEYAWRKPITGLVDGVPAVLDPATLNWVDVLTGSALAVATAAQVADYVGVNETKAQEIIKKTNNKTPDVDLDIDDDGANISIIINNDIDNDDSDGGYVGGYRCVENGKIVSCKDVEEIDGSLLEYIKNSYDYAVNAVGTGVAGLNTIVAGSAGLIALYANIFGWLPSEMGIILTSGLLLMIGLRVFRR